jgi:hypothetical protein
VTWKLALLHPTDALLVCRLPAGFAEMDLAYFLCQRGIPFRTLQPPPSIPRILKRPPLVHHLPVRSHTHKFTKADYESYVTMRALLLTEPHMQAAIKRGGLLWRLTCGTLGLSEALSGPRGTGSITIVDTFPGIQALEDDGLTRDELDLLCGAYECVSSAFKFFSILPDSWTHFLI